MAKRNSKVRKNFLLPKDLAEWVVKYANVNNTSMTKIIVDHLLALKKANESGHVEQI
jgi:hypothetical protein